jgi:hypothetical protein
VIVRIATYAGKEKCLKIALELFSGQPGEYSPTDLVEAARIFEEYISEADRDHVYLYNDDE